MSNDILHRTHREVMCMVARDGTSSAPLTCDWSNRAMRTPGSRSARNGVTVGRDRQSKVL